MSHEHVLAKYTHGIVWKFIQINLARLINISFGLKYKFRPNTINRVKEMAKWLFEGSRLFARSFARDTFDACSIDKKIHS